MSDVPWFSVGEEVILNSRECPECNGEYVVDVVVPAFGGTRCRITGKYFLTGGGGFGYKLSEAFLGDRGVEYLWSQSALKKKHKPSNESFGTMMDNLNKVEV